MIPRRVRPEVDIPEPGRRRSATTRRAPHGPDDHHVEDAGILPLDGRDTSEGSVQILGHRTSRHRHHGGRDFLQVAAKRFAVLPVLS